MTKLESELLVQIKQLTQLLEIQQQENTLLREQIAEMNRRLFGRKKETPPVDGQIDLLDDSTFNEPEHTGQESQEPITVSSFKRRKRKGLKALSLEGLPEVPIHYELKGADCLCEDCGHTLHDIGATRLREEPLYVPAHIEKQVIYQHAYHCRECETLGETKIKKAPVPKPLINNSLGSSSIVTQSIWEKFVKKVPAYRQEKEWHALGFPLDRKKITNWHIKVSEMVLEPIYNCLHQELSNQEVLHADETSYRVLNTHKEKTFYWLYASGKSEEKQVVLYEHANSRSVDEPKSFLESFSGFLHTDGYAAYGKLPVNNVYCWAHVRRKFFEALGKQPSPKSHAKIGLDFCDKMFRIERTFNKLSAEERFVARKETLQPVMTEFFHWCESFAYLPKSQLGKAVQYAVNHKDGLQIVLLDGRLELSNNRAERAIKELVIGRKNWLFSKSLKGARSNGIILSIIQTAVANGLNIRKYLNHLFTEIPNLSSMTPEALRAYLPWNQQIQEICK